MEVKQLRRDFESFLRENLAFAHPEGLYEPLHYLMQQGGKRLRPLLLLLAIRAYDEEIRNGLPAALAVELFHNFTLAHDDIMDEADVRRGKPAVYRKYGLPSGILTGDLALIYAYEQLCKGVSPALALRLMEIFNGFAVDVCKGQQLDMEFEKRGEISMDEYLQMIAWKTAVLPAGALQMGALIGGADEDEAAIFHRFGLQLGLAFQLQDDWLDTFGEEGKTGKRQGGDILQKKKTALVVYVLEHADPPQARALLQALESDEWPDAEKIARVQTLLETHGAKSAIDSLQKEYTKNALEQLDLLKVPEARLKPLRELAEELVSRKG